VQHVRDVLIDLGRMVAGLVLGGGATVTNWGGVKVNLGGGL
jgi:hypothetical protein